MYINYYSFKDSRRPLFKFLELFCVNFFSLLACLAYFSYTCHSELWPLSLLLSNSWVPRLGLEGCTLLQGRMPMQMKDSSYFLSLSLFGDYCPLLPIDIWRQLFHIFCSVFCLFMAERYIWTVLFPYGWNLISLCHL